MNAAETFANLLPYRADVIWGALGATVAVLAGWPMSPWSAVRTFFIGICMALGMAQAIDLVHLPRSLSAFIGGLAGKPIAFLIRRAVTKYGKDS